MSAKKCKTKYSIFFQSIVVIFIMLLGAGFYFYRFILNANFQIVVPGEVYRSAQPSPSHLRKWVNKYGIKTIINLRARKPEDIERETKVAEQLGIKLVPIYLSGRRLVSSAELLDVIEILETAEKPILIHCKSGIDRSGVISALAALAIGKDDFDIAKRQAYIPPGPWKRKDFSRVRADYVNDYAHISDTLKLYDNYCIQNNVDKNDWSNFKQWVVTMPQAGEIDIEYEPVSSYFSFLSKDKNYVQVYKLFKAVYFQFSIQIFIVVLLIYYTKFCLKCLN